MDQDRRTFLGHTGTLLVLTASAALAWEHVLAGRPEEAPDYKATGHWWGMAIDIEKCIGCGTCVRACKTENDVPHEAFTFRTWIERYVVDPAEFDHPKVESPNGGYDGFHEREVRDPNLKMFFVPKLCNHCEHSPCVQVCPVGATFESEDGVVLVDKSVLPRLPLLRPGVPVRLPLHRPAHAHRGQVQPLLPPHHQGAHDGLL